MNQVIKKKTATYFHLRMNFQETIHQNFILDFGWTFFVQEPDTACSSKI